MDVPYVYRNDTTGATWRPQNYTRRFSGRITLREALARSINNATIRVARRLGVRRILNLARRLGIRSPLGRDLSLSLGTSEVSLLELTEAYAAFPSGGLRVQAHFISRVVDRDGSVLYEDLPLDRWSVEPTPVYGPEAPVLSPPAAGVMTDLLRGAVFDPYATGARARSLGRDVAGKTGTTSGYRDAWFVGFSPTVATGVWVGHDRPISMGHGETGSRAALPIWVEYMEAALRDRPVRRFERRPGVVYRRVDHDTGLLADVSTRRSYWAAFVAGSQPRQAAAPVRERARARRMARWTLF
jgi:penicillin-binding protein 1A